MACDHNFARIPDDENTEGGGGRESDQSYARIPNEENNEALEPGGERRSVDKTKNFSKIYIFMHMTSSTCTRTSTSS